MLLELPISPNDAGQRAERFLRKRLPALPEGRLQTLFRKKEIRVGKQPAERGYMLQPGDVLRVFGLRPGEDEASKKAPTEVRPARSYPMPPVLFEDEALLVVDKPAGMAAHPGTGIPPGASLIERVRAHSAAPGAGWDGEVFEPSLVHRLDKETSGLLLVARTGPALRDLTAALRDGRVRKTYLALVAGHPHPARGVVDVPLERSDSAAGAKSRVAEAGTGKRSLTRYVTVGQVGDFALLEVKIDTGRMHQIRAHLAHIGHPIVGDTRYDKPSEARRRMREAGIDRMFLHAAELEWTGADGVRQAFKAPLPADLARAAGDFATK